MAMTGLSSIGGIAAALAISIAGPASAFSLDLRGIYCQREAEHSIGSDEDETFVVVTVFDNRTGALLAGPEPLPLDRQGRPTYWPDVDAGEFRPWGHRVWSGGARDLLIDVQTWEYDDHLRGALQAIFTVSSGLGAGLITKNPIVGLKATAAAKEVGDAVFGELKDADHDYLGGASTVILGSDMEAWAAQRHFVIGSGSDRIEHDFELETRGGGAIYKLFFDIY